MTRQKPHCAPKKASAGSSPPTRAAECGKEKKTLARWLESMRACVIWNRHSQVSALSRSLFTRCKIDTWVRSCGDGVDFFLIIGGKCVCCCWRHSVHTRTHPDRACERECVLLRRDADVHGRANKGICNNNYTSLTPLGSSHSIGWFITFRSHL